MDEKQLQITDKRHHMTPVEKEATVAESPNAVVLMAMQKGYEPALIEKMMELQEKFEKREAEKAYHQAMTQFKKDPPKIEKTKKADFGSGKASFQYADLADAAEVINKALSGYGLSVSWKTEQVEKQIKVTCKITHELGHSESTSLTAPPDKTGSKNDIQAIASTVSYLERYTLFALTGLAAHGMDDDGQGGKSEPLEVDQLDELKQLINETGTMEKAFLRSFKVNNLSELNDKQYQSALKILKAKK